MIIEIKGTHNHNKGAEMMLLTILNELSNINSDTKFTISPEPFFVEYSFYSRLGLFPKVWFRYKGFQFGIFGKFIPKKIRKLFGMITDEEVDVILDASGFQYSSQWGDNPAKFMAEESTRWRKMGKKVILLPQAFGPFETNNIKKSMEKVIENADLIYARDEFSYQALLDIKKDTNKIKLYPDFTVLFKGETPSYFNPQLHQVCIVPNQRIKDRRSDSDNYEDLFAKIIVKLQNLNLSPFFLIHGGDEDMAIAKKINSLIDNKIEIFDEENPYFIKGIIQGSIGLIGSRFHSLASALYAGVPAIGTGWSHKYKYLFDDFEFSDGLIDLDISDNELDNMLEYITNTKKRADLSSHLVEKKTIIENKSHELFDEIKQEIKLK